MACLDTSFIIDFLEGKKEVVAIKDDLERTEKSIVIPAPVLMELWHGACLSRAVQTEKEKIEELLSSFEILAFDEYAAKEAGEILTVLRKAGALINTEDIMIAAIAKVSNEKLITADADYTRIPGLRVLKY